MCQADNSLRIGIFTPTLLLVALIAMAEDQNRTFTDQYMLRLPPGMRDRLKELAKGNKRSMNAEVLAAIEAWIRHGHRVEATPMTDDAAEALGAAIKQAIETHPQLSAWAKAAVQSFKDS